jgi:hypothetical protein
MRALAALVIVGAAAMAACGSVKKGGDDGGTIDASMIIDAPMTIYDAMPDAKVGPTAAPPGAEVNSAGGRVTGGGYTMDVQLGTPFSQQPATGAGKTFEGNAPVKP